MVDSVRSDYPSTPLIAVGFSLGANLVCKYLGERGDNCRWRGDETVGGFIGCVSLCQAYDYLRLVNVGYSNQNNNSV